MKKLSKPIDRANVDQGTSGLKNMWEKCADKAKHGEFSCPFCKEEYKGLSALLSHLKSHCT